MCHNHVSHYWIFCKSLTSRVYSCLHVYVYLHIDSLNNYYIFFECIILVVNISNFICYYYLSNFLFVITISLIFYLLLLSLSFFICYYYFSNFLHMCTCTCALLYIFNGVSVEFYFILINLYY